MFRNHRTPFFPPSGRKRRRRQSRIAQGRELIMPTDYQLHATPASEPRRTAARHTRPRG